MVLADGRLVHVDESSGADLFWALRGAGAYNRRRPDETAFIHRGQLSSIEHLVVVNPHASKEAKRAAHASIERSRASVHSAASGHVYQCFPDDDLDDWPTAYYGDNYSRLQEIKARYDPDNLFRFQQSIEPRHPTS